MEEVIGSSTYVLITYAKDYELITINSYVSG